MCFEQLPLGWSVIILLSQHVLSDERVVAMARKAAENDDDDDNNTKGETYSVLPSIMVSNI